MEQANSSQRRALSFRRFPRWTDEDEVQWREEEHDLYAFEVFQGNVLEISIAHCRTFEVARRGAAFPISAEMVRSEMNGSRSCTSLSNEL